MATPPPLFLQEPRDRAKEWANREIVVEHAVVVSCRYMTAQV